MHYIPLSDYEYVLPDERIAKYPLEIRDLSKLLVFNKGQITNTNFSKVDQYLPADSFLIFNDTRVIQARLLFQKSSGANIEIFCLEPFQQSDYYQAFQQKETCIWKCLVGNIKKWKDEILRLEFSIHEASIVLEASKKEVYKDYCIIQFSWQPLQFCFGEILEHIGHTPIPPYLHRQSEEIDRTRYQTIYSLQNGSVAAPTAGLHFTPSVFDKLEYKNILFYGLTLHIGTGTFVPVKENNAALHKMHSEYIIIKKELIQYLLKYNGNITATGTTSLRALESLYWIGVKLLEKIDNPFFIDQWDAYTLPNHYFTTTVINELLNYCAKENLAEIVAKTKMMIVPDFNFRIVQRLITNFHQPKSTLLMLIAAFVGKENWKQIYNYALENEYRFLSYGDCSLLIR